ncbi:hypothetical protein PMAYCL1PPCAC_25236, partial [Pristionchus mayeri]
MKTTPPDGVIRFDLDYASLKEESHYFRYDSEMVEVKGVPWAVRADKYDYESSLSLSLKCNQIQSSSWDIDVN